MRKHLLFCGLWQDKTTGPSHILLGHYRLSSSVCPRLIQVFHYSSCSAVAVVLTKCLTLLWHVHFSLPSWGKVFQSRVETKRLNDLPKGMQSVVRTGQLATTPEPTLLYHMHLKLQKKARMAEEQGDSENIRSFRAGFADWLESLQFNFFRKAHCKTLIVKFCTCFSI